MVGGQYKSDFSSVVYIFLQKYTKLNFCIDVVNSYALPAYNMTANPSDELSP